MKVYAHRGASGEYPENSLCAFEQAILQQADGIELDVQYHSSGHWWLLHDLYVDNVTNGSGRLLALNKQTIQSLNSKANQPLVELCDALALINHQSAINIEVKISAGDVNKLRHAATQLFVVLEHAINTGFCLWPQLSISSFNHLFLAEVKIAMPNVNVGALIACCPVDFALGAEKLGATSINLSLNCLNKEIVKDAHYRGLEAWVYTVDRYEDIAFCYDIGIDTVFSNFPLKAKNMIKSIDHKT